MESAGQHVSNTDVIFNFDQSLSFFGVGLGGFQVPNANHGETQLLINSVDYGLVSSLTNYANNDTGRNMYLQLTADGGEVIDSVQFLRIPNIGQPHNTDFQYFDHVAMKTAEPIPEPTTMLLFGTGLLGLIGVRRRKDRK